MAGISGIEAFAAPAQQQREQKTVAPVEHGAAVTHRDMRAEPRVDPAAIAERKRAARRVRKDDPRRDDRGRADEEPAEEDRTPGRVVDITV